MTTRFIRPKPGLIVRDPAHPQAAPLPDEGKAVAWDIYWQRRLNDGDIEVGDAPAASAKAKGDAK